jgi:signal peptide peptidase SppA
MENKMLNRFLSKILKNSVIQKLVSIKIGRLLFMFINAILITLVCVIDTDNISIYISTLFDIVMSLIFFMLIIWRLNDIAKPRWLALGILIVFGVFYIENEMVTNITTVAFLAIIVLLSYLPGKVTSKEKIEEIISNIIPTKNKIFNKKVIISFILGTAIMFGGTYLFNKYKSDCLFSNVGTVQIFGEIKLMEDPEYISTSALNVIQQIEALDADSSIKGIVLDIASPGGGIASSEGIMLAVQSTSKPVVAVIRDMGASGAYLIATAADRIYANRMSDVGSIGVTQDFLDTSEKDRREGVVLYDFSSGKYKGAFKEHSKMTQEQRDNIMQGIMKSHDIFVEYVSNNRNIPIEEVKAIATGESWLGEDALKLGLIDQIGGVAEAGVWMQEQIGDNVSYCSLGK